MNEFGRGSISTGWWKYLGGRMPRIAFEIARDCTSTGKLFYNSNFDTDNDDDLAIELLKWTNGNRGPITSCNLE